MVSTLNGIELTHPQREIDAGQAVSKMDLSCYYRDVADRILPFLRNRLVSLVRCPSGSDQDCFYQRHPDKHFPKQIRVEEITEKSGKQAPYLRLGSRAGLIAGVQMGVLEYHIWGNRVDRMNRPDRLVFDLDPGRGTGFAQVRGAARDVRRLLLDLDLESLVMTTGGKGLHVVVPIERHNSWQQAHDFTRACARTLAERNRERYVAEARKSRRSGKVFIDYLRNSRGNTAICPYSARRYPGATIATPLSWDELERIEHAGAYDLSNIRARLSGLTRDPWPKAGRIRQRLSRARIEAFEH